MDDSCSKDPGMTGEIPEQPENTVRPDRLDTVYALISILLGYLFSRWVLVSTQGWGTAVFTALYIGFTALYLRKKGARFGAESRFWLAATLIIGVSFAFWPENGMSPLRNTALFCSAVYWVLSATGTLIDGRSGSRLPLDFINALFVIPIRNFGALFRYLCTIRAKGRKWFPAVLGVLLAALFVAVVTPQLMAADSGGFAKFVHILASVFTFDPKNLFTFLVYFIPGIPAAMVICGLVSGCALKRGTDTFSAEKAEKAAASARIFQPVTVYTVLGVSCALYILFIACQIPYFFSAFSGRIPNGWLSYSEYARQGFFELCRTAVINLALLAGANLLCRTGPDGAKALKGFNIVLPLLTLLLISTAVSKMCLYIGVFGLTTPRLLTSAFMIFLAFIFAAVIIRQKRCYSVVRAALLFGTAVFCALCLINPDGLSARYNAERYLSGTLSDFDPEILYIAGPDGVSPAIDVYRATPDAALKSDIQRFLFSQRSQGLDLRGTSRNSVSNELALSAIEQEKIG